jgi:enoyl-CoA hydratase
VASSTATFAHPETKFGAPPLFTPLRWIVGDGHARDLCLTGRVIDAQESVRIGLVTGVADPSDVVEVAVQTAATIAEAPAATLRITKGYMTNAGGRSFEQSFIAEHDEVFSAALGSTGALKAGDLTAGVAARRDEITGRPSEPPVDEPQEADR